MMRVVRARRDDESGAVLIIFAIAMVVLLGIIAVAIDGSYGFVQNRRAQNAADFAAFAAAQQLNNSTYCNGTTTPSTAQITGIIQELVNDNGSGIGTNWTARFLNSSGDVIPNSTFSPASASANPPPGACGVSVNATPTWKPFFAGIFGIHQFQGDASSSVGIKPQGQPLGILALNKVGPHEILGGGTGTFVVSGNIFLNTDVTHQPWTGSSGGLEWDDAIDAKTNSNLYVYGTIDTTDAQYNGEDLWPLDTCFEGSGVVGQSQTASTTPEDPAYQPGDPTANQWPANDISCSDWGSSVTVDYNHIYNDAPQIQDPLLDADAPLDPLVSPDASACPGMSTQDYSDIAPTQTTLLPGVYTTPVELTGSVNFEDCSGYSGEPAYPGVYQFEDGLYINPQSSSDTVTGSNIVIATENPYPMAGNVPGTVDAQGNFTDPDETPGNGAPCLPAGTMTSAPSGHGTPESEVSSTQCAGSSNYGVVAYGDSTFVPDTTMTGTGNNFSLIIGGVPGASVSLTGPTTGAYGGADNAVGLVLYQDPNTQANYGFDAETGEGANISVTGVVYDSSLASYGADAPLDYWDGVGGGIPFYAGGTLQTGFGAGWATADGPAESSGSFTLDGTAVVDDFNTDGSTSITILGKPYSLPGGGELSLIG